MLKFLTILILISGNVRFVCYYYQVIFSVEVQSLNICGDWIQYKDIKCFKVIEEKVSEEEAVKRCQTLDSSSNTYIDSQQR